eukprot:COSAG05_NODE_251_length_12871_cov_4.691669_5_plen_66_part_00
MGYVQHVVPLPHPVALDSPRIAGVADNIAHFVEGDRVVLRVAELELRLERQRALALELVAAPENK